MFTADEIKAMAFGWAFSIPAGAAAIYLGAPVIVCAPIFMLGFIATLIWLNLNQ